MRTDLTSRKSVARLAQTILQVLDPIICRTLPGRIHRPGGVELRHFKVLGKTVGDKAETTLKEISSTLVEKSAPWLSFGAGVIVTGILLAAFQQFIGINVVLYYAPKIFQNMGTKLDISLLQTVLVGAVNLIFTVIAIYSVDRLGRKPLLISGGLFGDCHDGSGIHLLYRQNGNGSPGFHITLYCRICHELGPGIVGFAFGDIP